MANRDFKVGDVVKLNSGSPDLTVTDLRGGGSICCAWIADGVANEAWFPPACLTYIKGGSDDQPPTQPPH